MDFIAQHLPLLANHRTKQLVPTVWKWDLAYFPKVIQYFTLYTQASSTSSDMNCVLCNPLHKAKLVLKQV